MSEIATSPRVLIVGGYGTFGTRLVHLLKDESVTLLVAGRSLARAQALCRDIHGTAELIPARFDRDGDLESSLRTLAPTLVIDASGPFQCYGDAPYRVIETCISQAIHYVDLADSAAFVRGVSKFDAAAKHAGLFVISGASTFPMLAAAVIRKLGERMARIDTIATGVAPSPHVSLGFNVIQAIAGYAGDKIGMRRDGVDTFAYGLLEQRRVTIAAPGALPLRSKLFSIVEVPDLHFAANRLSSVRDVWVGAATEPLLFHRMLIAMAWLRRFCLLPSLRNFARLIHWVTRHFRWGEHRGGLFVSLTGLDQDGRVVKNEWHLIAEGDDGPFIPAMGAACVVRRLLQAPIVSGARAALHDVALADYEQLFARFRITYGERTEPSATAGVFERVLGDAWRAIPQSLRAMHDPSIVSSARGKAHVERGNSLLARIVAWMFGFPASGADIPVDVKFDRYDVRERWTRRFGAHTFHSEMSVGSDIEAGLVVERFGLISIGLALVWNAPRLEYVVRRVRFGPIPLPRWLSPRSRTHERVEDGRFCFDVSIEHPLVGLLVHYRGWLEPQ